MVRILLILLPLSALVCSCQKEFSAENSSRTDSTDTSGNTVNVALLEKMVSAEGTDTLVMEYAYDAQKKLVREKETSNDPNFYAADKQITRNSQGIITKTVTRVTNTPSGFDATTETFYYYDAALARYTHTISYEVSASGTQKDSTVFRYNADGSLKEDELYIMDAGGTIYDPRAKSEYTFDAAGNMLSQKYSIRSGTPVYEWTATYIYEYDLTRKYPLYLGVESALLNIGAKNIPRTFRVDHSDNQYDMLVTFDFTFNSDQRPISHVTTNSLGSPGKTTYHYQ